MELSVLASVWERNMEFPRCAWPECTAKAAVCVSVRDSKNGGYAVSSACVGYAARAGRKDWSRALPLVNRRGRVETNFVRHVPAQCLVGQFSEVRFLQEPSIRSSFERG